MSLFSFIKLCCDGVEELPKPNAIYFVDDGTYTDSTESESSVVSPAVSPEKKAKAALRFKHKSAFSARLDLEDCDHFELQNHPKTTDEELLLKNAFQHHIFFEDLNEEELTDIISGMEWKEVAADKELNVEFLYVVQTGCLVYFSGDRCELSNEINDGELLCESGFLHESKTIKDIKAKVQTSLWRLHNYTYRLVLAKHAEKADVDIKATLRKVDLFQNLTENTINKFADALTKVSYKDGSRIITKGEIGEIFYIIEDGSVRVHDIGTGDSQLTDVILEQGDYFGERALITGDPRQANITAIGNVTALVMDRKTFNESIGVLRDHMDFQHRLHALKSLSIFSLSDLTGVEFERLAEKIAEVSYEKGTKLVEVGSPYPPNLWMILGGKLIIYGTKSDTIYKMQNSDYFGDKSIINSSEHISSHDATCETDLRAYLLTREDIESAGIDLSRLGVTSGFAKQKNGSHMQMHDLEKHRVVGQGGFGTVWLCKSRKDASTYALKIINKRKVLKEKQERNIVREKELLLMLDHPFILHMVASFQDKTNCYLVLPVIQGGELLSYVARELEKGQALLISDVAFYALQIIEGLGHFHQRYIAYRDLKLENVMIDADGYIKIVDLGCAKIVVNKSYTVCGTPNYMAPEIIMAKGHSYPVDYWSYGVLLYELLFGRSPFTNDNESQMQMFKRIVTMNYNLPPSTCGTDSHLQLVKGLLTRNCAARIGNLKNGYLDIRDHRFFKEAGVDVQKILRKEVAPPWIPDVTDPLDLQNFDDFSRIEGANLSSNLPLTAEQQAVFANF